MTSFLVRTQNQNMSSCAKRRYSYSGFVFVTAVIKKQVVALSAATCFVDLMQICKKLEREYSS